MATKSNTETVKELKGIAMPMGKQRTESNVAAFIGAALTHYKNGKLYAHMAACLAVAWAAEHGSGKYLDLVYNSLGGNSSTPTGDATAFKRWCVNASSFPSTDAQGNEVSYTWIGFNAKPNKDRPAGFYIKSGDKFAAARKAIDEVALKDGLRFMDKTGGGANTTVLMLTKLLADIAAIKDRIDNRAVKNDITLPVEVEEELANLAKVANNAKADAEFQALKASREAAAGQTQH